MAEEWHKVYDQIKPYVVRINTETGFGSGFLFAYNQRQTLAAIATAAHVVADAHEWEKPVKIFHYKSKTTKLIKAQDRVILIDDDRDAATILISAPGLPFPTTVLPVLTKDKFKKIGSEVGWVGFPSMFLSELCFFSGNVSAFVKLRDFYLIDGVAINGVSGGPVFARPPSDILPQIIGIVSAYIPNIGRTESLPGLLQAQDVTSFHNHIQTINSLGEAKKKESEKLALKSKEKPDSLQVKPPDSQPSAQAPQS